MGAILAVKTKQEFTVLAATGIFCLFKVGEALAARQRTPAYVIHLRNCVFEAKLFILFNQIIA